MCVRDLSRKTASQIVVCTPRTAFYLYLFAFNAGILKTFLGLSASILATMYGTLFSPNGIHFVLFLATAPACLALLALPLMNHVPHLEENETKHGKRWLTTGILIWPFKHL